MSETERFWNERYESRTPSAELAPNPALLEAVQSRPPGRLLELGCGHADASILLAERGWDVTAVDISEIALDRVAARAAERGVTARVRVERHDLATSMPGGGPYDLVAALFMQSPFEFDRAGILRRASELVKPGGALLDVTHGAPPPWAAPEMHDHHFAGPQEVWDALALPPAHWTAERLDAQARDATGPDGQTATLLDTVVLARRR